MRSRTYLAKIEIKDFKKKHLHGLVFARSKKNKKEHLSLVFFHPLSLKFAVMLTNFTFVKIKCTEHYLKEIWILEDPDFCQGLTN